MTRSGYAQRIKGRIQHLEAAIEAAQTELDELRVAERVIERLGNENELKGPDDGQIGTSTTKGGTVADMAIQCLEARGPSDTLSILTYLQENWRADLKQTTLASTLSRAKSEGRVNVVNGRWHLAKKKEEPPEGGSQKFDWEIETSQIDDDVRNLV